MKKPIPLPTQDRLLELFSYDAKTGDLVRKIAPKGTKVGDIAGSRDKTNGYICIGIDSVLYRAHRLIWKMVHGYDPAEHLDHINHSRDDNRIDNLREASRLENQHNQKCRSDNTSGTTGVYWHKKRRQWYAMIKVCGQVKYLGCFTEKLGAVDARKEAEIKYGFHHNHGLKLC